MCFTAAPRKELPGIDGVLVLVLDVIVVAGWMLVLEGWPVPFNQGSACVDPLVVHGKAVPHDELSFLTYVGGVGIVPKHFAVVGAHGGWEPHPEGGGKHFHGEEIVFASLDVACLCQGVANPEMVAS